MRTTLRSRLSLLFMSFALVLAIPAIALAAELVTAELAPPTNRVTVEQGKSATFDINLKAEGAMSCEIKETNASTAKVKDSYSITKASATNSNTAQRVLSGSTFSAEKKFWSNGTDCAKNKNSAITWTGAPNGYNVPATVSVAADVPVGTYTIALSATNGTSQITNPTVADGAKLEDSQRTDLTFEVVAPPPPSDTTAPVIDSNIQGLLGGNGWYKGDVLLSWTVVDNESAISSKSGCDNVSVTSDQNETTYTCSATSAGGTTTKSVTIKRDATAPTNIQFVGGPNAGGSYDFGSVPNEPTCAATDATSTVDTCVVTGYSSAVGDHTLTATATDKAGNKATATRTYTVNKATPTIAWNDPTAITYGTELGADQLNATAQGVDGNSLPGSFSYDPSAGTKLDAGTHTLSTTFTPTNTADYKTATKTVSLVVNQASQEITFGALAAKTYGDSNFNVSATGGNSGNPVTFAAAGKCAITGANNDMVGLTGAGSCTITASQNGNNNYSAARDVSRSFAIAKATPTIAWNDPTAITYGTELGADQLNATAQGVDGNSLPGSFSYDPSADTKLDAGTHTLSTTFTPTNTTDYNNANASVQLTVNKADQRIDFGALAAKTYGDSNFNLSATGGNSGNPVTFTAAGNCSVSGNTVQITGAGSCTITASQAGNANYNAAPSVDRSFTIARAATTTTVTCDAGPFTYNGTAHEPCSASVSGFGLNAPLPVVSYQNNVDAGQATASASYAGSANYLGSSDSETFQIQRRAITVTADAQSKTYGDADPALTYQITSGSLANPNDLTGNLTRIAGETVTGGPYAIQQGTLAGSGNYNLTFVGAGLTINPRAITVTADAQSKTYGNDDPALTFQVGGDGLATDDTKASVFTGSLTRVAGETVLRGPYAIQQGTLRANSNYNLTSYTGANFTINPRAITVKADAQSKFYGDADPALTSQITSGNLVNGDVFSGALSRDAGENVGNYAIRQGSLALSSNYALSYDGANLTIKQAPITIKANDASRYYNEPNPAFGYSIVTGSFKYNDLANGDVTVNLAAAPTATATALANTTHTINVSLGGTNAGNYALTAQPGTLKILAWTLGGFYAPVNMDTATVTALNTVKNGSTVPLKFEVFQNSTELTSTEVVDKFTITPIVCPNGVTADPVEFTTTGSTSLRYDTTAGQFIQNWQTPKKPGACYDVTMLTDDGSKLVAHFQLK